MSARPLPLLLAALLVAAAAVWLVVSRDGREGPAAAGAERAAEIEEVPDGPVPEELAADAGALTEVEVGGGSETGGGADQVREQAREEGLPEAVRRTYPLAGRIVDQHGEPLAGASIMVFRPGIRGIGGTIVGRARTDVSGAYWLRVPRNMTLRIEATADGYRSRRIDMRESGGEGHDVQLEPLPADTPADRNE